jgi:hypothetical protein
MQTFIQTRTQLMQQITETELVKEVSKQAAAVHCNCAEQLGTAPSNMYELVHHKLKCRAVSTCRAAGVSPAR